MVTKPPNQPAADSPQEPTGADSLSLRYGSSQPGEGVLLTPSQKAATGVVSTPKTVTMEVLQDRSYGGRSYHAGDTVDVPEEHVETLTLSGFGARSDRVEAAQKARETAAKAGSKPVKPLSTVKE